MSKRLSDVARKVGVSEATVSRVLNEKPGVSQSTRQAVLTALDVLGYERPTKLRGERARLVGLVLRGLRTLHLRVERHAANALAVASYLADRDDIATVNYPGLADGPHAHPAAATAARQMRAGGGMVSFIPAARDGRSARQRAVAICEATRIFTLAESLGGVESLIELPAVMTHLSVAGSKLEVDEALVRLSVGIEAVDDLIADLARALDRA